VPIGLYHIDVEGNEEYQPSMKTINIVNEEDKDELVIFVGVRPRIDTSIEFQFL
jgi:hypothetical protein